MRAAISWSGGKDSMLALLRAREQGLQLTDFLTLLEPDGLSKSHGLPPALLEAQVQALGGQWRPARVPPGRYGECFDAELAALRAAGAEAMVFGDIDLQAHRDWITPRCERAGLQALFPLWGLARAALATEVLARDIRARIVCVDCARLDASFSGREYDAAFLAALPAGVCPAGEDGEFHSFVWDGPGFAAPLPLQPGRPRLQPSSPPLRPTDLCFCIPELA